MQQILLVSFGCAVVRFMLIAWGVDSLWLLLFAQVLHAATFGSFHAASVAMIHHYFQGRHQSKGQALFGSFTYGAGGVVGGLASGPLWQHFGAGVLYSCSASIALLGLMLMSWQLSLSRK
jgi:PPP family 3-phenylpropionic acid transporter